MAADLTTVQQRVTTILDACIERTFTTTVDKRKNWNASIVTEAVREAALMIAQAICANPGHVHRNLFISGTPTALTHGAELPDMAGESDLIEIQPYSGASYITGTPKTAQQIDDFRTNRDSVYGAIAHTAQGSPVSGYYNVTNGRVKFTGNAAQIYIPVISRSTATGLIPDEYEGAWTMLGAGLCGKVGADHPLLAQYYRWGMEQLPAIQHMTSVVTKVPPVQRAYDARSDV
jgi:hypothetical protein